MTPREKQLEEALKRHLRAASNYLNLCEIKLNNRAISACSEYSEAQKQAESLLTKVSEKQTTQDTEKPKPAAESKTAEDDIINKIIERYKPTIFDNKGVVGMYFSREQLKYCMLDMANQAYKDGILAGRIEPRYDWEKLHDDFLYERQVLNKYPLPTRSIMKWFKAHLHEYEIK